MVCQNAIAITDILPENLLYGTGDLLVDLLSLLCEDGVIDDLFCEGVLENVGAVGIDAPFIEKFGILLEWKDSIEAPAPAVPVTFRISSWPNSRSMTEPVLNTSLAPSGR